MTAAPAPPFSEIFGPAGLLAAHLSGFEFRQEQRGMAEAVSRHLNEGGQVVIEAETGIGKTLAYLIPAALSGQKIVISTATLNLQDQIFSKEIPFIRQFIAPGLTALKMKGRQNYFCLHRWHQFQQQPSLPFFTDPQEVKRLNNWLQHTVTGDRAELDWLADDSPLWREFGAGAERCLGSDCPEAALCFVNQLRQQAGRASLLIVNHHLFFSDLALRNAGYGEVLPRYASVIFDEAHQLENIATQYFGLSVSQRQLTDLATDIGQTLQSGPAGSGREEMVGASHTLAAQARRFGALFPETPGRYPLRQIVEQTAAWQNSIRELNESLTILALHLQKVIPEENRSGLHRRSEELQRQLAFINEAADGNYVYWFEKRAKNVILSASPIEIASEITSLYEQTKSVIFTSATIKTGGDFSYFFNRLGLPRDTESHDFPSPFDYKNRTLLYIPADDFPLPSDPDYFPAFLEHLHTILMASKGRALCLFTSISSMKKAHEHLAGQHLPFPLLVQGTAPKAILLDAFRHDVNSVLLAVASFWEGIDVPGEALSCLIIDKLPFEVPSDPVIMARLDRIKEKGGNPFFDFQVPRAILSLRQGIGRLIRGPVDTGLLAVMDVRLFSKNYGRFFRQSLPASPVTRDLHEVKSFFMHTVKEE